MRFSLVMRANWDFYECNKILSLHNNELPCFSHRIIIHTSNQPKHIFLSELNRALCKCCSSSTVENDSITTRGLFSNYYLFFSCSCTIILLLITHPNNVLGWHCSSVLHIRCPVLVFSISKFKKGKLYILWIPAWKTNTSIDHTYIDYLTCPIARMFIIALLLSYLGWSHTRITCYQEFLWIGGIPSVS